MPCAALHGHISNRIINKSYTNTDARHFMYTSARVNNTYSKYAPCVVPPAPCWVVASTSPPSNIRDIMHEASWSGRTAFRCDAVFLAGLPYLGIASAKHNFICLLWLKAHTTPLACALARFFSLSDLCTMHGQLVLDLATTQRRPNYGDIVRAFGETLNYVQGHKPSGCP